MPNAEKITNNLMGGSHAQRYISPMQAGMMHRTLALKSTRKYVKKGTYSPIPLVINSSEVWDFNLKLYRDVVVSSGATLTLTEPFELPYNGTITVSNGAILIIENMAKLIDNNKIIVQAGGILKLESGSSIDVNNGHLEIQSGGKLILNSSSKFSVALGSTLTVELGGEILYL
jgi:hypothetical protein